MTTNRLLLAVLAVFGLTTFPLSSAPGQAAPKATTGRIVGKVLSASGSPVPGANVTVTGTALAASTAVDGRYTLLGVPAGTVEVQVRRIGYRPKVVSGIQVQNGSVVGQDISLESEVFQLEAITVTAAAERGTVNQALEEQRNAPIIISAATAEQIAKSPDSDAGQAVRRVSGVTVQDDKYVFVRGLGERYTTTSLNSARIPSPEPERKVVPLDLFPSSLLEAITTSKTFTPEQPGDFSGASVNLKTREFPLGRKITFNSSVGYNTAATGRSMVKAPTVGREWLGVAGGERQIPASLGSGDLAGKTQADLNQIMASFRNVWSPSHGDGAPNGSFGLSVGGEDPIFRQPIGYLASFTYSYGDEIRKDEHRALAVATDNNGDTRPQNAYVGSTGTTSVLWGGLLNLSTRIGTTTKISSSNTYTRSADNSATSLAGLNEEFSTNFDITRLTFTERTVRSNQLSGEHLFGGRHKIDWVGSASGVRRYEPDRSDLAYIANVDTTVGLVQPLQWFGGARSATRTFSDLHETAYDGALNYRLALGSSRSTAIKIGGLYRHVNRDADSRAYDIFNLGLSDADRTGPAETVLSPQHALAGDFYLNANANGGSYTAAERLYAGYAQFEIPLVQRVRVIGGARVERSELSVDTRTTQGQVIPSILNSTDVLPSLALQIQLSATQNLRFSASRTLSRPEYRELSPVPYFDILGGLTLFGNPRLKRALIQNYDTRWEWYPGHGEAVAIGVFAKRFQNPIEKIIVAQTGADALSFVNAEAANNYGVELELRKNLGLFGAAFEPFTVFANTTLMHSKIRPGNDSISSLTNANRPMVGQAGYVVNAGLGYSRGGWSATALYNVVGRRIVEAGTNPRPDAYEEARNILDLSFEFPLVTTLSAKLNAKNLLDAPYLTTQGQVERVRYHTGRSLTFGLSWTPTGAAR